MFLLLGLCFAASSVAAYARQGAAPPCRLSRFSVGLGPRVSEATGQETLDLRLTNRARACVLDGYPSVAFFDASGPIPFRIHDGGDQMLTRHPPHPVLVRSHGTAFVAVNKYRCDMGGKRQPTRLRLASGTRRASAVTVSLATSPRDMSWCGANDPGSTVDVSPYESTRRALGW